MQTISQMGLGGDFMPISASNATPTWPNPWFSFAQIQDALTSDKDPPYTHLNNDVNADANVMVALICHADGLRPAKVCGRPYIKSLLKHIK